MAAALLAGCAAPPRPAPAMPSAPVQAPRYAASFDCTLAETPVQLYVCRDAVLAALDVQLDAAWREQVRRQDLLARAELLAEHRHWQLGLYAQCQVTQPPDEAHPLPPASLGCLTTAWRERLATVQTWRMVGVQKPVAPAHHPLAAYVSFREADAVAPPLCRRLAAAFDEGLAREGRVAVGRVTGAVPLAALGGPQAATLPDGRAVEVLQHDAGPYGSYALRATGLRVAGLQVIDDRTVPGWLRDLPNGGGDFSGSSSQTGDYGGLDVFTLEDRPYVLVTQTWGYHASAARGESPHAALYELAPDGPQRRCLWRTYVTPPVADALRSVPQFKTLQGLLDEAAGPDSPRLPPPSRRDAGLLAQELQWNLLHMPLVTVQEAEQLGRWSALRQRHDEALEALFTWSERNVPSKQLYRRLMPLLGVAHAELVRAFRSGEGLNADEARAAADLQLMTALARAAERWQPPQAARPALVGAGYRPRFAVAPAPGDLERDRAYSGLHSALLNRAPDAVVDDLWRAQWGDTARVGDAALSLGPAGDTPLMAAVRSPERVKRLLVAGADVNARNDWGKTALMMAAQADQAESVDLLLAAGADAAARTASWQADGAGGLDNAEGARPGSTALGYAVAQGGAAVIERLLPLPTSGAADRDARDERVCKALSENPRLTAPQRAALAPHLCRR